MIYSMQHYGISRISANATTLVFEFVWNEDGAVHDTLVLTRNGSGGSGSGSGSGAGIQCGCLDPQQRRSIASLCVSLSVGQYRIE